MPIRGNSKSSGPLNELAELRQKLSSPRTRYRQEAKVVEAVQEILQDSRRRGLDHHGDQGANRGEVPSGPTEADRMNTPGT